ncbi:Gamma-secretase subunit APH1-like [Raphanus sativus]|nr:Gamma-secretase subunit APH1-like [Raphanus sativus]
MTVAAGIGYALLALGTLSFTLRLRHLQKALPHPHSSLQYVGVACEPDRLVWTVEAVPPSESQMWCGLMLCLFSPLFGFQEALRFLFWKLYMRLEDVLDSFADRISRPRLFLTDKLQML